MPNLFRHPTRRAACLVNTLHALLHSVYFAYEMPKQVRHDVVDVFVCFGAPPYQTNEHLQRNNYAVLTLNPTS
jgi:hypothetical protein